MSADPMVEAMSAIPNIPARPIDAALGNAEELERVTNGWLKKEITTPELAAQAQDLDVMLLRAWQSADAQRTVERAPHLEAAEAVQRLYTPVLDRLNACRKLIGDKLRTWKLREQARVDAERAAAVAKAAEAAREAEEARKKAEAPKTVADVTHAQRLAEKAAEAAKAAAAVPQRAQVRGAVSGRASGLRRYVRVEIEDMDECYLHYKASDELRVCLTKIANAEFRIAGDRPPGCKVVEEWR